MKFFYSVFATNVWTRFRFLNFGRNGLSLDGLVSLAPFGRELPEK
jgi:hypothetical protein